MEIIQQLLSLSDRPAFCAEDGTIIAANDAAQARQIRPGEPVEPLLASGAEALSEFHQGFLCLTLALPGQQVPATVTALGSRRLFTLEPGDTQTDFRLLSLASQELREPLSDVMALVDALQADPEQVAGISRGLHRLLRLISNMTPHPTPRLELMDVGELLRELWDKTLPACESRDIRFRFTPSPLPVYSCVDGALLNRAIYNLLSNAIKFSRGGAIELQLSQGRRFFQISLRDSGSSLPDLDKDPFARFLREPGTGDPRCGMGLGMRMVHDAAMLHGGTVLMDSPPEGGVRVTLSLPLRQNLTNLRSPRLQIPYTGGRDPMLVELSDVLPTDFYK